MDRAGLQRPRARRTKRMMSEQQQAAHPFWAFAPSTLEERVPRDIFPLPELAACCTHPEGHSRSVHRKALKRQHQHSEIDNCRLAVNALYTGYTKAGPPSPHPEDPRVSRLSLAQSAVFDHLRESVESLGPPLRRCLPQEL